LRRTRGGRGDHNQTIKKGTKQLRLSKLFRGGRSTQEIGGGGKSGGERENRPLTPNEAGAKNLPIFGSKERMNHQKRTERYLGRNLGERKNPKKLYVCKRSEEKREGYHKRGEGEERIP